MSSSGGGKRLVVHGRRLDELTSTIVAYGFGWRTDPGPIKGDPDAVLRRREVVRAYEREVEDYLENVTSMVEGRVDVLPATQMLAQLQRTYDRAYDLCTFKLTAISVDRSTWASLILAALAIAVALYLGVP